MGTRKLISNYKNAERECKTKRLEMRVSDTTIQKLDWIKSNSAVLQYKSYAEILATLVEDHVLMQELMNYNVPRFKKT
jgi:hypothetical protein